MGRRTSNPIQDHSTPLVNGVDGVGDLSVYFEGHKESHLETSGEYVKALVFGGGTLLAAAE